MTRRAVSCDTNIGNVVFRPTLHQNSIVYAKNKTKRVDSFNPFGNLFGGLLVALTTSHRIEIEFAMQGLRWTRDLFQGIDFFVIYSLLVA